MGVSIFLKYKYISKIQNKMKLYIFTKEVTLTGSHKDGHVPRPTQTFPVGKILMQGGTFSPASSYPVAKPATVRFSIGDESYETEASNLKEWSVGPFGTPNPNPLPVEPVDPSKFFDGLKRIGIIVIIVLSVIGILKLFKVF